MECGSKEADGVSSTKPVKAEWGPQVADKHSICSDEPGFDAPMM